MFIAVNFKDNDFSHVVREACEAVLGEISRGHEGEKAIEKYMEVRKDHNLENIRQSIVFSSYGYYLANKGARSFYEKSQELYDVNQYEDVLTYLDEHISVEEIRDFTKEWENSEVCYLDFYSNIVHLQ